MSLRKLVAGSDVCAPSDGAGPPNAVGSLASTLLGTSKTQERLREVPHVRPGGDVLGQSPLPEYTTPQAAVRAAVQGDLPTVPGMEFIRQSAQPHYAPQRDDGSQAVLSESFKAFVESGQTQRPFVPAPLPHVDLTDGERQRIQNRSSVLARHLFADQGPEFADEQAVRLLNALHIEPTGLPGVAHQHPSQWQEVWNSGTVPLTQPPLVSAAAHGAQAAWENLWEEKARRDMESVPRTDVVAAPQSWGQEFLQEQPNISSWLDDFTARKFSDGGPWVDEFQSGRAAEAAGLLSESSTQKTEQEGLLTALIEPMMKDIDPKFRNSRFLQFVSKLKSGELIIEGNKVVQGRSRPANPLAVSWAAEFGGEQQHASSAAPAPDWASEFRDAANGDTWAPEFGSLEGGWPQADEVEEWAQAFERQMKDIDLLGGKRSAEYDMASNNPFLGSSNPLQAGMDLFQKGILAESVLALEAEISQHPDNAEAWRLLGMVHAENEDDNKAIAALTHAHEHDPSNVDVQLRLGVSYGNELREMETAEHMLSWLKGQFPDSPAAQNSFPLPDASQQLSHAIHTFEQAAIAHPGDANVHTALGVLQHLARNFNGAADSFKRALELDSEDYSLWNKLGATLANSSLAHEAIGAYQKALDIKPNYVRGWTNLGISFSNLGQYAQSLGAYARALTLNPDATTLWGNLRSLLLCTGHAELLPLVDNQDLPALRKQQELLGGSLKGGNGQ